MMKNENYIYIIHLGLQYIFKIFSYCISNNIDISPVSQIINKNKQDFPKCEGH